MRALLAWGFGVSIALHALLGPIVGTYKTPIAESPEVSIVSLSRRATIKLPTPVPTPQPTEPPTPPPDRITPPPRRTSPPPGSPPPLMLGHPAPPQARLKINAYQMTSKSNAASSTEENYRVQSGSQAGVPQGTLASAPAATGPSPGSGLSTLAGTPGPPVRPTPPPSCGAPDVEARATRIVAPFYPEAVRELGGTGEVDVLVSLSTTGAVTAASIFRSAGNAALDQAAMRAARESSYSPEIVACQATAGSYTFHASFTLDAAKP